MGKVRLYNMIRDRGDWVISRQRAWGVPLPIFYAEDGTPIMTAETIEHVAQLFEEHGSIIWWQREAKDLLPEGFTHPGSPNGEFTKKLTSWTSGLTQVHHGMGLWLTVQNSNTQPISTLKVLTNTVVGSTHHSSHLWRTMVSHHTKQILSQRFRFGWER